MPALRKLVGCAVAWDGWYDMMGTRCAGLDSSVTLTLTLDETERKTERKRMDPSKTMRVSMSRAGDQMPSARRDTLWHQETRTKR